MQIQQTGFSSLESNLGFPGEMIMSKTYRLHFLMIQNTFPNLLELGLTVYHQGCNVKQDEEEVRVKNDGIKDSIDRASA